MKIGRKVERQELKKIKKQLIKQVKRDGNKQAAERIESMSLNELKKNLVFNRPQASSQTAVSGQNSSGPTTLSQEDLEWKE